MAETKTVVETSTTKKRKPERKPRVGGIKPSMFGKDVRTHLRKAKFKNSRKIKSDETAEERETRLQKHLPPPQPKVHTFSSEEDEKNEESEEEFLSYVKATVSDNRTYNFKDDDNCSLGCCKSCGLLSHDLSNLKNDAKSNFHKEFKHSRAEPQNSQRTTAVDEKNASGDLNDSKPDKSSKSEIDNLEDELESLLTMKGPISKMPIRSQVIPNLKIKEPSCTSSTVPTKSVDLEKWLETVLDV